MNPPQSTPDSGRSRNENGFAKDDKGNGECASNNAPDLPESSGGNDNISNAHLDERSGGDPPAALSVAPSSSNASKQVATASSVPSRTASFKYDPNKITLKFIFANRDGLNVTLDCKPTDTVGEVKGALLSVWPEGN